VNWTLTSALQEDAERPALGSAALSSISDRLRLRLHLGPVVAMGEMHLQRVST